MTEINTLADAISNTFLALMENIHTCMPGRVETYEFETRKASVKPLIQKSYIDGTVLELPVLNEVPVIFPMNSLSGLTFPINKGDMVLIHFSERSLDKWYTTGTDDVPNDNRKFSLADAVCIPGLYSFNIKNLAKNNTDLVLHHNGFTIRITKEGKISLKGKNNLDLLAIVDEWMTQMKATKVITGIGLQPFDPTSIAAMTVIQNKLKEILV